MPTLNPGSGAGGGGATGGVACRTGDLYEISLAGGGGGGGSGVVGVWGVG